jgi:hypothetical protein
MTPERWQKVEGLFHLSLEREASQRAAFLDEACAGDPDLRGKVESLLIYDGQESGFLETPASKVRGDWLDRDQQVPLVGRRIGPYQVTREIGRGGMGAVYVDDQYQKQVAIKLIKRGMDTETLLRRFRTERQILANLDHPNIAKLLDGGTTEEGSSYFIMDYVDGRPIDLYCDTQKLTTGERLGLFRTVCSAVGYAHQNRVVLAQGDLAHVGDALQGDHQVAAGDRARAERGRGDHRLGAAVGRAGAGDGAVDSGGNGKASLGE